MKLKLSETELEIEIEKKRKVFWTHFHIISERKIILALLN